MRAPMSLLGAAHEPSRLALVDANLGTRLTHGALRARVAQVAAALATRGTRLLALADARDSATAVAWLGAFQAGCAVLWLAPSADDAHGLRQVDTYRPDLVLPSLALAAPPPAYVAAHDAILGPLWQRREPEATPLHARLACLLSTSGSTGRARVVRLSAAALQANAAAIVSALELRASDVALLALPLAHAFGLSVLNSHLLAGGCVVLSREGPLRPGFWRAMREHDVTCLPGVPLTYELLRRLRPERLLPDRLRLLTQAGGRLALDDVRYFRALMRARAGELRVMYGQTEATARISAWPRELPEHALASVGRVLPGGELRVAPDTGEILYRGPNVMLGYAEARADLAREGALDELRTGDLGRLDEHGFLYVDGRLKRIAKLGGRRIDLDQLERPVAGFATAALEAEGRLVVAVEGADRTALENVAAHLRARLSLERAALDVRAVERLPRTPAGKVAYAALADECGLSQPAAPRSAPRSATRPQSTETPEAAPDDTPPH